MSVPSAFTQNNLQAPSVLGCLWVYVNRNAAINSGQHLIYWPVAGSTNYLRSATNLKTP